MIDVEKVLALFDRGVICVPVRAGTKHPDYAAMGLPFDDVVRDDRALSRLAFDSLAFWLSQYPPDLERIGQWFHEHRGNVGIVAGHDGLVVLDLDNADYFDRIVERISRLSKTFPAEGGDDGSTSTRIHAPRPTSALNVLGGYQSGTGFRLVEPNSLVPNAILAPSPGSEGGP